MIVSVALGASKGHVSAQNPLLPVLEGDQVEGIAAVVGDSVITLSQVDEEVALLRQNGIVLPPSEVLDDLINQMLVLQVASRDSTLELQIDEEALQEQVEQYVGQIRTQFASPAQFQAELERQARTEEEFRAQIRHSFRSQQIVGLYMQQQMQDPPIVTVSDEEMRAFFAQRQDSLQARPETYRIRQVFVETTPSDEAWSAARQKADSLRRLILTGSADFASLARDLSDDVGTAENGGDLGWFRRGLMVPEFDRTAFNLPAGGVSEPVRTQFGYHLIRVERRRPGEVKAGHILLMPEASEDDVVRARERAQEVVERARAGEAISVLYDEFSAAGVPLESRAPRSRLGSLPYPDPVNLITGMREGEVVGPIEVELEGRQFQAVLQLVEVEDAGEYTYEELRDEIRSALTQQKRLEAIYEGLRRRTYVDIRM